MKIDLHIHTKTGSDGNFTVEEVFREAKIRNIELLSITDHDSIKCQEDAMSLAKNYNIAYITGVELNVSLQLPNNKSVALDFLGYGFDINNSQLKSKLQILMDHRVHRAHKILDNLNVELENEGINPLTEEDLQRIQKSVDGAFSRPHIANYLIKKRIASNPKEAFDKYLVKCDVPKSPLSLSEASTLIRNAGGILIISHANDPNGTSLIKITHDLEKQAEIIETLMLDYIDGIECWHSRHDSNTSAYYAQFAKKYGLIMTGGSDCHQNPILMGTVSVPTEVASWFINGS